MVDEVIASALSVTRWTAPLLATFLGVACFQRVGVVNIAANAMISLGVAVHVALALRTGSPYLAFAAAVLLNCLLGGGLMALIHRLRVDGVLFTLAANSLFGGLASQVNTWAFGVPGMGSLGEPRLPPWFATGAALAATALGVLALLGLRSPRLGITFGLSNRLARAEGMARGGALITHGCIGGALLGFAAAALAEIGGGYSVGIAGERGFLAILVIAACWPRPMAALIVAPIIGILQAWIAGQGQTIIEPLILALAIIFLLGVNWFRGKRWPDGKGIECLTLQVAKTG